MKTRRAKDPFNSLRFARWLRRCPADRGLPVRALLFATENTEILVIVSSGRTAYYLDNEGFSGATIGLSLGLPLSTGRVFAEVGGGPGLLIVSWESANKELLCLNAGLQLSVRFSSRLALGFYSTVGLSTQKTLGGIFLCLQCGRWEF